MARLAIASFCFLSTLDTARGRIHGVLPARPDLPDGFGYWNLHGEGRRIGRMSERMQGMRVALPWVSEDRRGRREPGQLISHLPLVPLKATGSRILMNF